MSDHVTCLLKTIVFSLHLEYPKSLPRSVDHCIIWPLPRFLNTSLLLSFSLTLLQSHWPFCSSWNMPSTFLLWGLYTSSFWSFYDHSLTSFRSLIRYDLIKVTLLWLFYVKQFFPFLLFRTLIIILFIMCFLH